MKRRDFILKRSLWLYNANVVFSGAAREVQQVGQGWLLKGYRGRALDALWEQCGRVCIVDKVMLCDYDYSRAGESSDLLVPLTLRLVSIF